MKNALFFLYFCISPLFVVEATLNVCFPLATTDSAAASTDDILQGIKKDVEQRLVATENEQDLFLDYLDINITHPAIDLYGFIQKVKVYNLLDFNICFLGNSFANSTYYEFDAFNLTFKNIRVEGRYNLDGDLGDLFDLYGDGNFWVELRNLSLALKISTVSVTDEICFPISIDIYLPEIGNWLDNFMYDDELEDLFNRVLTSILPEGLRIIWNELKDIFDAPLQNIINDIFGNHNVAAIFKRMKNPQELRDAPYC